MITVFSEQKNKNQGSLLKFVCLSTDTKPQCGNGSVAYIMDTETWQYYDSQTDTWNEGQPDYFF